MKMGSGKCYIIGAGEETKLSFTPGKEDFVIACDGGYDYCKGRGSRLIWWLEILILFWRSRSTGM